MKKLIIIIGSALVGITSAFAQQDIVGFLSPNVAYSATGTFGFSFSVSSPLIVTGLSSFTNSFPPSGTTVGLWNSSQNLLASVVVTASSPTTTDGFFAYSSLSTPITLGVGTYYVGAEVLGGVTDYANYTLGLSSVPGVTFLSDAYNLGAGLNFPSASDGITGAQGGGDFGGNVVGYMSPVPEPETIFELSLGLAGLATVFRNKFRSAVKTI